MILKAYAELPPRKRIGILAIILGVIAAIIGSPCDTTKSAVNLKELSMFAEKDIDKVSVNDLAKWIIEGKMDYRLIDLRNESEYNEYNIPSSENIPVQSLLTSDLMRNEKIILYSDDNLVASQAWFILKAADYKSVYILDNGMEAWKENIVFPSCTCGENPTVEQKQLHSEKAEVAKFFGGQLETGSSGAAKVKKELPKLKAPKKVTLKANRKKPSREGC